MEFELRAHEWTVLTPAERARRCRVMADEALERADKAPPNRSSGYLEIAERWLELADDMEKYANRDGEPLRTSVEAQS